MANVIDRVPVARARSSHPQGPPPLVQPEEAVGLGGTFVWAAQPGLMQCPKTWLIDLGEPAVPELLQARQAPEAPRQLPTVGLDCLQQLQIAGCISKGSGRVAPQHQKSASIQQHTTQI